jgi:hypothetical protein
VLTEVAVPQLFCSDPLLALSLSVGSRAKPPAGPKNPGLARLLRANGGNVKMKQGREARTGRSTLEP